MPDGNQPPDGPPSMPVNPAFERTCAAPCAFEPPLSRNPHSFVATTGIGVFDTLKAVAKQILVELRKR